MTGSRVATEHRMKNWDGAELFYRAWPARNPSGQAVVMFHRGHEHSGRMQDLVDRLGLDEYDIFAWDARGHGQSPGERGDAEDFGVLVKDADAFVRHVSGQQQIPIENMVVLAHSVGAVIASGWVHDYAPPIRGMVLAAPAFRVKLYVPLAIPFLRLRQAVFGRGNVKSYVKATMLTHDRQMAEEYKNDPLIFRQISVRTLLGLYDASTRIVDDAGAINVPTLLLAAGSDWVVQLDAQKKFFDGLSSTRKEMEVYPGFYHALFHEAERERPIGRARDFIRSLNGTPRRPLLDADRQGYTRNEYERLAQPLSPFSPRGVYYRAQRIALNTVARLSKGVQVGFQEGFDSGLSLDYVYQNEPQGISPLGRMIDRIYLNSPGWTGIRQRKIHLERALRELMERLHGEGRPVQILDIAAGGGRYVLEAMAAARHIPASATLRDYKQENLDQQKRLAAELGVENVTIVRGDAFNRASLASVQPRPTIGIVSGLYELFPDNPPVLESLRGIAEAIEPGGFLIYTGQPWHPQVEYIARVLDNREGDKWIMRRRSQAEMDDLVQAAGFKKLRMDVDQWGIFTVSVAERCG